MGKEGAAGNKFRTTLALPVSTAPSAQDTEQQGFSLRARSSSGWGHGGRSLGGEDQGTLSRAWTVGWREAADGSWCCQQRPAVWAGALELILLAVCPAARHTSCSSSAAVAAPGTGTAEERAGPVRGAAGVEQHTAVLRVTLVAVGEWVCWFPGELLVC